LVGTFGLNAKKLLTPRFGFNCFWTVLYRAINSIDNGVIFDPVESKRFGKKIARSIEKDFH